MTLRDASVVVAGAGSIGCYAGGCLALAGRKVTLLVRPRIEQALLRGGLRVTDLEKRDRRLSQAAFAVETRAEVALNCADIVLVTTKSGATEEIGRQIAAYAPTHAIVVSLQNGIDNAARLAATVDGRRVLAGMVPFNVVQQEGETPFRVHRASEGTVLIESGAPGISTLLNVEGFATATHADMRSVQWGKLLFNLNNALVALSDLPLSTELADRRWRLLLARQIDEALTAMKAVGIRPGRVAGPPSALLPTILRLPNFIFLRLARQMLAIDPQARSSMWEDLQQGRRTEIDELQGAILRLAARSGVRAPLVERIAALVREAEERGQGSPKLAASTIEQA
ncbi:2-dehydropantoate 2-reductase [Mesorhizobium amorphae]|uniref:2-dehydropantoate 2-reductase n=1 Tax=Mesorhizobium amorphae TaxID=71433 RepID=UPI0011831C5C|nr:2-dehydropantoate 2-reductase [Mesorhizobium amorphae]